MDAEYGIGEWIEAEHPPQVSEVIEPDSSQQTADAYARAYELYTSRAKALFAEGR